MLREICVLSVVLSVALGAPAEAEKKGQIWAVLVAGSNTYDNYRHQADVCHAYQIFHRHGIPDSNIIVMMYDDIAHNPDNPNKGVIINQPGGPNVYKGVLKDYTGTQVTPDNFVHVLTGNKEAMEGVGSGKVLASGPNDHVFVNFVDHGATGLIGFPNGVMYADTLIKALKTMHQKKMYKKLVFYMEACESGSMFNKILPQNIEIFATTAANPGESSYACYFDNTLQTYLGDEYSVSWMEDIDYEEHHKNITTETLQKQYKDVVKRVVHSHPSMYGEEDIEKDHVKDFLGVSQKMADDESLSSSKTVLEPFQDSVSSRDVSLHILNRKIQLSNNAEEKAVLQKKALSLLKGRRQIDDLFEDILGQVTESNQDDLKTLQKHQPLSLDMMSCYRTLVDTFNSKCVNINKNTYALGHLYKLANLCATKYTSTENILQSLSARCNEDHQGLTGIN